MVAIYLHEWHETHLVLASLSHFLLLDSMNILIIEDDDLERGEMVMLFRSDSRVRNIHSLSSEEGFSSVIASLWTYDVILTDLMLDRRSYSLTGLRIIEKIHQIDPKKPIMVISGMDNIDALEEAFRVWATEYLIKPFRLHELCVRTHHLYRKYLLSEIGNTLESYISDSLSYDKKRNLFSYHGVCIDLSRASHDLLSLFCRYPWRILSERFLREKIWWDRDLSFERNIRVPIMRLRKSLAHTGLDRYIITHHGDGYMFDFPTQKDNPHCR